ncbi:MAG: ATP-binding protein [Hyphomicrobiales bacterium]|nr:ATP-binding protein [Hyphomicrobiales bacterium]
MLRALAFIAWFIQHSFGRPAGESNFDRLPGLPEAPLPCQRFNDVASKEAPVEIGIRFSGPSDLLGAGTLDYLHCRYEYQLALGGGDLQPTRVVRERLSYWPLTERGSARASKQSKLFDRHDKQVSGSNAFHLKKLKSSLEKVLRNDVSVISTLVQLNHNPSILLRNIAVGIIYNIFTERYDFSDRGMSLYYQKDKLALEALNKDIQRLDLGIQEVRIDPPKQPNMPYPEVSFVHHGLASPLAIAGESHGTRQFFKIFPLIYGALNFGGVAIIDELDTAIHPLLLPEIIRWFYSPERNPRNAQLWLTCQHSSLLGELSKEEIFFCQKDRTGATSVFGLRDIKPVRRSENYIKKYLSGEYGAVPHIG